MAYEYLSQFSKMLNNLSALLDKAQAHSEQKKCEVTNLLTSRLVADQFAFARQVQLTCDTAKAFAARLTGKEIPKHEDREATVPELQERIRKTIAFLDSLQTRDFEGWQTRKTTNPRKEGKFLPGDEYAMQHAIPNFYFHLTTAYSILRSNGVDIGKKDYLGEIKYRDL